MNPSLSLASGVLVGILANLGFGPVTILAVTRRLRYGVRAGMEVGIACSALDGAYCFLAAEAAGFMTSFLAKYSTAMKILGSLILFAVALGLLRQAKEMNELNLQERRGKKHASGVISTMLLFVSNPMIPVFWLTIAGFALTYGMIDGGTTSALFFSLGCALGGILRYIILMKYILKTAERIKIRFLKMAVTVLALVLVALAAYGLLEIIMT